ncbi:CDP-alcohol phosphatidyltransferase [Methanocorpusculum labreanum Z]|uniref:CDP-alcohol phosphatidyltransferase n=1 Tax=Methanocorpusculum labreanum (strain ATCC 43576 / DSM 4855 / Z) TaxID=410358 RepID=A2SSI9_METLZ|nr:CDP-alcohol phosphatidyltransferase family protein [Methanocorpusculum labreanum]ABN07295.1 CDP-alcohol phosphatidyltransferase [Methanocorpusculum labreanum Z]
MSLDSLRPKVQWILTPIAEAFSKLPITPNMWTVVSLFCALIAGIFFGFGLPLFGVLFVVLNSFLDVLDGALARHTGAASPIGDYLDHVFDRYADVFIITGIIVYGVQTWQAPVPAWVIGLFAITGVLLSSYMGTQAQAVGLKRNYGGVLGRADRLVLLMLFGLAEVIYPAPILFGLPFLGWMLVVYGFFGHITAIQRFVMTLKELLKDARAQ